MSVSIVLTPDQVSSVIQQAGGGTGGTTPPVIPSTPPGVVNVGLLPCDGTRHRSVGMNPTTPYAMATIVVPNAIGKLLTVAIYTDATGTPWRKACLSRTPGDFTSRVGSQGISVNLNMVIGDFAQPGEILCVNVKNENSNGSNSCASGANCDFGITAYPPA